MDIQILVAAHKKYWMPEDNVYLPLHVGAEGKEALGYTPDNTGDNISGKNATYCELTGLYWAWKNLHADYVGLCHYRRYFGHLVLQNDNLGIKKRKIFIKEDYENILSRFDIILSRRILFGRHATVEAQYSQNHYRKDLCTLRQVLQDLYPADIIAFDRVMKKHGLHCYNMFVMRKADFDEYCQWLFSILFESEKRIDISGYDLYQKRVFGFLAERLLDVWLFNRGLKIKEVPVVCLEEQESISRIGQIRGECKSMVYKFFGW